MGTRIDVIDSYLSFGTSQYAQATLDEQIEIGSEFYFAFKYRVTDVSANGGFNYLLSVGRRVASQSGYLIYLPESNGQIAIDQYNNNVRVVGFFGYDFGATHLDGLTHTVVVRVKTDGNFEFWVDALANKYTNTGTTAPMAYPINRINLNGYYSTSGNAGAKMGADIFYFYLYSALSDDEITALMAGAKPSTVGTIRHAYDLNGNGLEAYGRTALTLSGAPQFKKDRVGFLNQSVGKLITNSAFDSIMDA